MPNNKKDFSEKDVRCHCGFYVGRQTMDAQILVLPNGLIAFNYLSFQCPNGHNASWLAPILLNEQRTVDTDFPDSEHLKRRAAMTVKRVKTAQTRPTYGIYQHKCGKFVVTVGGYVGSYETHDEAVKVRDVELAKQFGYKSKHKQTDEQPQKEFAAS